MGTTMTYGSYPFDPVPLMTLTKEKLENEAGLKVGETYSISLRGTLVNGTLTDFGIIDIDSKQDQLMSGLSIDGKLFEVKCNSSVLLQCFPRIKSIEFSDGIWVQRSDYTIGLEFDELAPGSGQAPYLKSTSEDWQLEFIDEKSHHVWDLPNGSGKDYLPYQLRLNHTVSANGKAHYITGETLGKQPWEYARDWVISRSGYDSTKVQQSGVLNFNPAVLSAYNHIKSTTINEEGGSFSLSESWLVLSSGNGLAGKALEDYNISVRTSIDTGITTVGIDGSVNGLDVKNYDISPTGFVILETKYANASGYWNVVKDRLFGRCNLILDTVSNRDLNIIPVNTSIAHNPSNGTINYSFEYNDRPSNCISGSRSEVITITDNNQTDVFASITVLGKTNGPVLQDLSTKTAFSRSLSIEVVMEPISGCPNPSFSAYYAQRPTTQVNSIVSAVEADLTSTYNQVFKSEDSESWQPKDSRYSRNVSWVAGGC